MGYMKKRTPAHQTPRSTGNMLRINQRAHTFKDRKKEANRKACRGKVYA